MASGPVQDGGMSGHNNPVRIALSERRRNDPSLASPDIVISLGTGTQRVSPSPSLTDFRHVILDGYLPRLWRSYMSSFNGQRIWDDLVNSVEESSHMDYIRLNSVLPSDEPAIDNTDRMAEMRLSVRVPNVARACKDTLYALLISAFYFELSDLPEQIQIGRYCCRGTIRCRLPGIAVVNLLKQCDVTNLAFLTAAETLGQYEGDLDLCLSCRRYQKHVEFHIHHHTELVTIYVHSAKQGRRKISAFPQTMQWFVAQQRLDAPFGTAFHQVSVRTCTACLPQTLLKRQMSDQSPPQRRKKVRR